MGVTFPTDCGISCRHGLSVMLSLRWTPTDYRANGAADINHGSKYRLSCAEQPIDSVELYSYDRKCSMQWRLSLCKRFSFFNFPFSFLRFWRMIIFDKQKLWICECNFAKNMFKNLHFLQNHVLTKNIISVKTWNS